MEKIMDKKKLIKEIRSWVIILLSAFILAFLIDSEVFAKVTVEQSSMENTLLENQQLLVDIISYDFHKPERGDIIIFYPDETKGSILNRVERYIDGYAEIFTGEEKHTRYVKRVIGVEGDEVDIRDGYVYINGTKSDEPYVNGTTQPREFTLPYTVGKNELFVLGDNRGVSKDSRSFGPINMNQVIGKVFFRVYPFNKLGKVE
jgi:signal peptidase I